MVKSYFEVAGGLFDRQPLVFTWWVAWRSRKTLREPCMPGAAGLRVRRNHTRDRLALASPTAPLEDFIRRHSLRSLGWPLIRDQFPERGQPAQSLRFAHGS